MSQRRHSLENVLQKLRPADSLSGRFARGAVWSLIGAVISQGANLGASVVIARLLGREQFGEYGMIQSTVVTLGVFAGAGIGVTATKYVAEFRNRDPERAGRVIGLGTVVATISGILLSIGLFAFARVLAVHTLDAPDLVPELRIGGVLLFFNAVNGAQIGALAGFEAFRAIARINFVRGVISLPLTFVAVLLWKLPGAIWALAGVALAACIVSQLSLRRHCAVFGVPTAFSLGAAEFRIFWHFSIPVVLTGATSGLAIWGANTMLVNRPQGYLELAVFSAASQWKNAILFAPLVLAQFALPLLSNLYGEGNLGRYEKTLRWHLALTALASTVVALPVALAAPQIMGAYGRDFKGGWLVLVLSAATAVIACLNGVVGTAILSAGSVWTNCAFNGMWAAVLLLMSYWLVPRQLALGLATSTLIAYIAHSVWQSAYLWHRVRRMHFQARTLEILQNT